MFLAVFQKKKNEDIMEVKMAIKKLQFLGDRLQLGVLMETVPFS